jgi:predicted extracellular nuclease
VSSRPRVFARPASLALIAALAITLLPGGTAIATTQDPATVWINEIHYDNTGTDSGEAIEIAGPSGTDLSAYSLVLYNGGSATAAIPYDTRVLSGLIPDQQAGFGTLAFTYAVNGIQNGAPDGLALVKGTEVVQFLSYEGAMTAAASPTGGPASGLAATDISVAELGGGAVGNSLRLSGTGSTYQDFAWNAEAANTFGAVNTGQVFQGMDAAPFVASTSPEDDESNVLVDATLTVTFNEAVDLDTGTILLDCGGADIPFTRGGTASAVTIDPDADLPELSSCLLFIAAGGVHDVDVNDPPDTMAGDVVVAFETGTADACAASDTPIASIQGSGDAAAITGSVTIQGVVVGDYEGPSPALRGFYLQDAGDGAAATSDGIFVFNNIGGTSPNLVTNGQVVQVSGNAGENQGQTQVSAGSLVVCDGTGSVIPTDIDFPVATPTFLERFEGMLIRVPEEMTVTEHFQLGRFGQVVISSDGRLQNPTAVVDPGAPALALQAANNLRKIIVDDDLQTQNPDPIKFGRDGQPLSASNTLRGGDTITNLTGVMTFTWAGNAASGNAYRIRPINALNGSVLFEGENPRPGAMAPLDGQTSVAALNLLNYFNTFTGCTRGLTGPTTDCRGASNQPEFDRQIPKTVAAILGMDVDVLGVNEIENDGYGPTSAIAHLVDALNAQAGAGTYAFIDVDAAVDQVDALGDDAIKVGLIYRPGAVTPVGDTAVLNDPAFTLGGDDPAQIPANQPKLRSRPSLAQAFETPDGARFIVDVNHFKSKGSPCNMPSDQGDGQGNCNVVRTNGATELVAWLAEDPTGTGDEDVLIMGDLNSYAKEDPIEVIEAAGYTNLVADRIADPYSYVFDGQWGYLDHALGSPSVDAQVVDVLEWHINSDEPSVLDYLTDFKSAAQLVSLYAPDRFRVSDHDPILVGLDADSDRPTVDAGGPYEVEEGGSVQIGATGSDPTGDDLTYAWDLDGDGSFETAGDAVTFEAGTLQAPQTVTVTVQVTDEHGQTSTDTADIRVIWDFGGFQAPSTPAGVTEIKAGSSHPLKFSLDGPQGEAVLDGNPTFQRHECPNGDDIGAPIHTTASEPFAYDAATDTYRFTWKTQKAWAGWCGTLTVALADGETYDLEVIFKP